DPRPDRRGLLRPALRRGALRDPHERGASRRDRDRPDAGPDPRPARRRGGPRGRRRAAPGRLAAVRGRPPARRRLVSSSVESARASAMTAFVSLDPFPLDGSVKTLGWGIVEWAESYLLQPDGDDAGEPYTFTREQLNFLLWFYAVDSAGRFVYRRGVLRRAKGWGKSPFLAALAVAELLGPVRFAGWDEHGEPIGRAHPMPWIVIAGVSETQTENTFAALRAMVEDSALVEDYGLDVGLTRILTPTGGKIVPITASS